MAFPSLPPSGVFSIGINLSGAENQFPSFPQLDEMTYLAGRISNLFRFPLCWSKPNPFFGPQGIQLTPFGDLNPTYLASILTVLNNAASLNARMMPDIHMFGSGAGISGNFTITSLTSVGTLVTCVYAGLTGAPLINGVLVAIVGATQTNNDNFYNGSFAISNVTPTTFQYTAAGIPANSTASTPGGSSLQGQEIANVGTSRLPISAFVDLWVKFAAWLQANAPVGAIYAYDFMNEWAIADLTVAFNANQAITTALRAAGDNTLLLYEGNNFSGAWNWTSTNDNFYQIVDPANNNAISPHCYADYDSSGQHMSYLLNIETTGEAPPGLTVNSNIIVQRLQLDLVPWALRHGKRLIIGEGAVSSDPINSGGNNDYQDWNAIWDNALAFSQTNKITYFWWGNGPGFGAGYPFNLSPTNVANPGLKDFSGNGLQATQTVIFDKYTGYSGAQPTAYRNDLPTIVTAQSNPEVPALLTVNIGNVGVQIPNFLTRYNGLIPGGGFAITPHAARNDNGASAGGSFSTSSISLPAGKNALTSFAYTPAEEGYINISTTNGNGLTDPPFIQLIARNVPTPNVAILPPWTGANLSGMESNGAIFPVGQFPYGNTYSNYYYYRGMNIVRIPFKRERVQPRLFGSLANTLAFPGGTNGLDALDLSVNDAVNSGMVAILDIHDFGGTTVTIDISSVSVTGTTATCTVADTTILISGATLTLGATSVQSGSPSGAMTIVNSTTFTMPVPNGTPSSGTTTGTFPANIGTAGYSNSAYADFCSKLATRYASYPNVIIDLMNEPASVTASVMAAASQAAITAIRATTFSNYIFAEVGGSFSSASLFSSTLNSVGSFLTDPLNKLVYEVHSYLDAGGSGTHPSPSAVGVGAVSLIDCTEYARAHGLKLFLGEFGISTNSQMIIEVAAQLDYLSANTDIWVGWTAWTTSPYVLLPPEVNRPPFQFPPPGNPSIGYVGGVVTDQVMMPILVAHGLSTFSAAPPTGINMNWVPGFDGGFIPATASIGTILTGPMTPQQPNIDGAGSSIFSLVSNPGGLFSINGSNELVLAGALTDFTTFPFSINVINLHGVSATFAESVICNSITTIDPATVNNAVYTLSNGNLTILHSAAGTAVSPILITKPKSGGKWYFEVHFDSGFTHGDQPISLSRIFAPSPSPPGNYYLTATTVQTNVAAIVSNVQGTVSTVTFASVAPVAGDTLGFAWNATSKQLWVRLNGGNWNNSGAANPVTGVGGMDISSLPQVLYISYFAFQNGEGATFNFGATTYANTQPVGFNNI